MQLAKRTTILFDLDGTLLTTRGAGFAAMREVLRSMFGLDQVPEVPVHGRTDTGIVGDVFAFHGIDFGSTRDEFFERYVRQLETTLPQFPGDALPGARELLSRLRSFDRVATGILTGNCRGAARLKLRHVGLEHYLDEMGGYGCTSADRNVVAERAIDDARRRMGRSFDPDRVWVVGDTLNDIRCARHVGARVLAVATGGDTREDLARARPDILVETFLELDVDRWLGI